MFCGKFLSVRESFLKFGTSSEEWMSFLVSELVLLKVKLSITQAVLWLYLFAGINIHSECA